MEHFMNWLGLWLGALMTFGIYSFLYKDNPFYKVAEQIFVGLSAGYWFVYTIYFILIPNLFNKIGSDFGAHWLLIIPGILGIMMLTQIVPKLAWLSRYPIALMIGTTAGISFMRYMKSDVISQMTATMINPFSGSATEIVGQILLVAGTISGVMYFFFSKKHEGAFGVGAKIGIYFLMVSFGAAFGYTAMARISLLIGRLQFILFEWAPNILP